jgi:hypothetical protein
MLEVSGQHHIPAALPLGTHYVGGWVFLRVGVDTVEKRKFLTTPGLELRPVASRYTDCAIAAPPGFARRQIQILPVLEKLKNSLCSESASELYRPSDLRLSAKSMPTFAD